MTSVIVALVAPATLAQERGVSMFEEIRPYLQLENPPPDALHGAIQSAGMPRDSLRNGAVIGALVGGIGTFAFGMYLCRAIREEGDPPCLKPALVLAGVGAGAGAAAGAGIDALSMRHSVAAAPRRRLATLRVSVRF